MSDCNEDASSEDDQIKEQSAPSEDAEQTEEPEDPTATATRPQLTLISTEHWLQCWFEQLILPTSRYTNSDIEYVSIATGSFADHISLVKKALRERPNAICFACTNCAMGVYSAAVAMIRQEQSEFPLGSKSTNNEGVNFHCFFLATNKLACRTLVAGCDDLQVINICRTLVLTVFLNHLMNVALKVCSNTTVFMVQTWRQRQILNTPPTQAILVRRSEATMVSEPISASLAFRPHKAQRSSGSRKCRSCGRVRGSGEPACCRWD